MNDFSIFNSKGGLRDLSSKADKTAIAGLSPDHKEKFFAVVEAFTNAADAETKLAAARENVKLKIDAHNAADMAYQGIRPWRDTLTGKPISGEQAEPNRDLAKADKARAAAMRAVSAAQRPGYKPAPIEVDPLKTKLDAAKGELDAAYLLVRECSAANDIASKVYGVAVNGWRSTLTIATFDSNVKAHLATMVEHRAARVAKGLSPEFVAETKAPEYQTPFDADRAARGLNKRKPRPLIAR